LAVPEKERESLTWGNDVLMQVQGVGAFVRVLLPVRLTGGYSQTFGVWLGVHPDDLKRAWEVWPTDEYRDLALEGVLANAIPPWDAEVFGAPARATVVDKEHAPYITASTHAVLSEILTSDWPHAQILPAVDRNSDG
jgi:hypothetical protein